MENIEAMLCAYIEGDLDEAGRAQIENHLKSHPQHRKLLHELTEMRDMVRALPRVKAPMDVSESLHQKVERSMLLEDAATALPIRERGDRWPQFLAIAAILLLVSALCFIVLRALAPTLKPAVYTQAVDKFQTQPAAPMGAPTTPSAATGERDELLRDLAASKAPAGGAVAQSMPVKQGEQGAANSPIYMDKVGPLPQSAAARRVVQNDAAQTPQQNAGQTRQVVLDQVQQQQRAVLMQVDLSAIRRRLQNSGFGIAQNGNNAASTTLVLVNSSNPAATGQQITQFLNSSGGISWNAVPEDSEGQNGKNAGGFGGGAGNRGAAPGGEQPGATVLSANVPAPAVAGGAMQPMMANSVAGSQFENAKATTQPSSDVYVAHGLTAQQVDTLRQALTGPPSGSAVQVTVQAVQGLASGVASGGQGTYGQVTGGQATTAPSVAMPKGVNAMGLVVDQAKGGQATSEPSDVANAESDLSSAAPTTMPSAADYGKDEGSQQTGQALDAVIVLQPATGLPATAGQVQMGANITVVSPTTQPDLTKRAPAAQSAVPTTQPEAVTTQP